MKEAHNFHRKRSPQKTQLEKKCWEGIFRSFATATNRAKKAILRNSKGRRIWYGDRLLRRWAWEVCQWSMESTAVIECDYYWLTTEKPKKLSVRLDRDSNPSYARGKAVSCRVPGWHQNFDGCRKAKEGGRNGARGSAARECATEFSKQSHTFSAWRVQWGAGLITRRYERTKLWKLHILQQHQCVGQTIGTTNV